MSKRKLIRTFGSYILFCWVFIGPFLIFMISYSFLSGSWKVYKKENTDWVVSFSGTEAPLIELFFQISYPSIGFFILSVFIASVATWQQISKSQRNISDDTIRMNNAKQNDQVKSIPSKYSLGKFTIAILCIAAVVALSVVI